MFFINSQNNKQKKFLLAIIVVLIVLIFFFIFLFSAFLLTSSSGRRMVKTQETEITTDTLKTKELEDFQEDDLPSKTVFALYGVDKENSLADVIIVASFDKIKNSINLVSIPRDTYVEIH